jgi:hypothetical protein
MSKSRREEKTEYIKKIPFKYNYKQFQDWCSDNDQLRNKTIDSLVDICGNLGKKERSFHNQAKKMKQNYPEVRYAVYLIEDKGYEKQFIICENYTLSYDYANMLRFMKNLHSKGTKLLRDVLNDVFFIEFDKLANLNKESITKPIKNIHVDLCAINHGPRRRQLNFIELK